ncbi:hypothetical protein VKT23_018030 [Stygiomarasmius scandens]|uniref:DUF4419 domain-containing protein n=1 Tax=Marasmiellus scandens TaxID=2682957 RepID=A0ABR1IUD9_9AGAR
MPITFHPAKHSSNPVRFTPKDHAANRSSSEFLKAACSNQYSDCKELLQSSWEISLSPNDPLVPLTNGFVDTVRRAYSEHHALSIRPDDVWICILTQFNNFVNGNAEKLRDHFVDHEGKKKLVVADLSNNEYTADFGYLSNLMAGLIQQNVKDPELADWIIPKFSTTTHDDVVVSSVVMMATMQEYFIYEFLLGCGLPSVTLEGEKSDYEELLKRIERLNKFAKDIDSQAPGSEQAKQLKRWYECLGPILKRFVQAFDDPHGQENLDFWERVAHVSGGGSSVPYYSGWITAFCVFDNDGRWIGRDFDESEQPSVFKSSFGFKTVVRTLVLDGITYPVVHQTPYGYASVPVILSGPEGEEKATMVAGMVGMKVMKDSVKPLSGWCIFKDANVTRREAATSRRG